MNHEEISQKVKNNEIILLDVREKSEWDDGHIDGAINIPLSILNASTATDLSKDTPVYVYCRSGGRAETAKDILQDIGFSDVQNIGGILGWQASGGELII